MQKIRLLLWVRSSTSCGGPSTSSTSSGYQHINTPAPCPQESKLLLFTYASIARRSTIPSPSNYKMASTRLVLRHLASPLARVFTTIIFLADHLLLLLATGTLGLVTNLPTFETFFAKIYTPLSCVYLLWVLLSPEPSIMVPILVLLLVLFTMVWMIIHPIKNNLPDQAQVRLRYIIASSKHRLYGYQPSTSRLLLLPPELRLRIWEELTELRSPIHLAYWGCHRTKLNTYWTL